MILDKRIKSQGVSEDDFIIGTPMKRIISVQHILHEGTDILKSCFFPWLSDIFFAFVQNNCYGIKLKAILFRYHLQIF